MTDDTPAPTERNHARWMVDPFGGISWVSGGWSHGIDVASLAAYDDPAGALAALVECVRKAAELAELRQAVWDAYGILGFDQDGDTTPDHLVAPPLPVFLREFAREERERFDEACEEAATFARKAEVYDRIAEIVAEIDANLNDCFSPSSALGQIARLFPEAD